tara:strand:+ start:98067 stop:98414 length:348 start_codon:yes stop_codon:yes gene_type:complete
MSAILDYEVYMEQQQFNYDLRDEDIMKDEFMSFWMNLIDNPPKNRLIIDGVHYTHEGMKIGVRKEWRGSNGKTFTIQLKDGTIIKTNSLWHQGTVPADFRPQLQDNAEFVCSVSK